MTVLRRPDSWRWESKCTSGEPLNRRSKTRLSIRLWKEVSHNGRRKVKLSSWTVTSPALEVLGKGLVNLWFLQGPSCQHPYLRDVSDDDLSNMVSSSFLSDIQRSGVSVTESSMSSSSIMCPYLSGEESLSCPCSMFTTWEKKDRSIFSVFTTWEKKDRSKNRPVRSQVRDLNVSDRQLKSWYTLFILKE